ncbi:MAG: polysaccharide biosynthesis C-terminal domain-containing protein [Gammaproteobacteria bacterium]|nr:polysaccharide biosynthesis C-terminal domain-containing protein [Gammaproteobacteria bacterium]
MLKKLVQNSSSNVLVFALKLVITFVMTPVLVINLGDYDYGINEIIISVIGYMGLLDMGLLPTMSRFASRHNAKNEHEEMQQVFSTSMLFLSLIGIVLGICFFIWAVFFPASIAPEGADLDKYSLFLIIVGIQVLVTFPGFVAQSFLEGLQFYHIKNKVVIYNSVIGSVLLLTFITPENALILITSINTIGVSIKYLIYFILLSRPTYGGLIFKWNKFSMSTLKELLVFGFKSFVQGASYRLSYNADNFIIAAFMGPAYIVFFAIPSALVRNIRMLILNINHAFLPLFSDLSARGDKEAILKYYINSSRYLVGLVVLTAIMAALLGPDFISLWIGSRYSEAGTNVLYVLILFTIIPLLNPFSQRYLIAIGEHGIFARLEPIAALANILLSIWLVVDYGLVGIALGSMIPALLVNILYLKRTCFLLEISVLSYIKDCWLPSVLPAIISLLLSYSLRDWQPTDTYLMLFIVASLGSITFLISFIVFSNSDDKVLLKKLLLKYNPISKG